MELAQAFMQHSSGDFGVPVTKCAEEREQNSADDHVMKVGDDKAGAAKLPIEGRRSQHDAGEAGDQKLEEETNAEEHWRPELNLASPHRTQPLADLNACRYTHSHCGYREKAVGVGIHSDREHVVRPNTHAHQTDANRGTHHDRESENRLARKPPNNFRRECKAGNDQDIHLAMPKYPKE